MFGLGEFSFQDNTIEKWHEDIVACLCAKDYNGALLYFDNLIVFDPNNASKWKARKGMIYFHITAYELAIKGLSEGIEDETLLKSNLIWLKFRAEAYVKQEEYSKAIGDYRRLIKLAKQEKLALDPYWLTALGDVLFKRADIDEDDCNEAGRRYQDAVELFKTAKFKPLPVWCAEKADMLADHTAEPVAIKYYLLAISSAKELKLAVSPDWYAGICFCHLVLDDYELAIANASKAIALAKQQGKKIPAYYYAYRAEAWHKNSKYAEAVKDYSQAIKTEKENPTARYYEKRGDAYRELKKNKEAQKDYLFAYATYLQYHKDEEAPSALCLKVAEVSLALKDTATALEYLNITGKRGDSPLKVAFLRNEATKMAKNLLFKTDLEWDGTVRCGQ